MKKIIPYKKHTCILCGSKIEKGQLCYFDKGKIPKYKDNIQVGLQYYSHYCCLNCIIIDEDDN